MTEEEKNKLKKKYITVINQMEVDEKRLKKSYGTNGPKMSNYMSPSLANRKQLSVSKQNSRVSASGKSANENKSLSEAQ